MEAHQLPSGTYLEQNKYYIERVLGDGGFGITYLGYDVKLQRKVAIKEFICAGTATGIPEIRMFTPRQVKNVRISRR